MSKTLTFILTNWPIMEFGLSSRELRNAAIEAGLSVPFVLINRKSQLDRESRDSLIALDNVLYSTLNYNDLTTIFDRGNAIIYISFGLFDKELEILYKAAHHHDYKLKFALNIFRETMQSSRPTILNETFQSLIAHYDWNDVVESLKIDMHIFSDDWPSIRLDVQRYDNISRHLKTVFHRVRYGIARRQRKANDTWSMSCDNACLEEHVNNLIREENLAQAIFSLSKCITVAAATTCAHPSIPLSTATTTTTTTMTKKKNNNKRSSARHIIRDETLKRFVEKNRVTACLMLQSSSSLNYRLTVKSFFHSLRDIVETICLHGTNGVCFVPLSYFTIKNNMTPFLLQNGTNAQQVFYL